MTEERRRSPAQLWGSIWIGVFLVGIGILFYLDSQGVIDFFPGILILAGILVLIGGVIRWATRGR